MIMEIQSIFTKTNQLKISIIDNPYDYGEFKICFSLVYSIQNIEGGDIAKKVGRYYEINSLQKDVTLTLQQPRIGSYNLSCGPEGLFVIGKNEEKLECNIIPLQFEEIIPEIIYSEDLEKIFHPIIPLPLTYNLKDEFINIINLDFKIPSSENNFFKIFNNFSQAKYNRFAN